MSNSHEADRLFNPLVTQAGERGLHAQETVSKIQNALMEQGYTADEARAISRFSALEDSLKNFLLGVGTDDLRVLTARSLHRYKYAQSNNASQKPTVRADDEAVITNLDLTRQRNSNEGRTQRDLTTAEKDALSRLNPAERISAARRMGIS